MKIILGYKAIGDLRNDIVVGLNPPIQNEKRGIVQIAVIDDQTFEAGRNLKNFGYDIVEIGDPNSITVIGKYSIILCDLMDVGLSFDSKNQGATLIREIRRNYPAVVVAAYTGSSASSDISRRAKESADRFIQKDADLETWTEELDALIALATNPKSIWERTRRSLVEENVETKKILELEDAFVRSINRKDPNFSEVQALLSKKSIAGTGEPDRVYRRA